MQNQKLWEKKLLILIRNSEGIEGLEQTLLRIVGKQEKVDSPFIYYAFSTDLSCISEPWDKSSKKQMRVSSWLEYCL